MSTLERMHNDCDGGQCAACEWERQQHELAERTGFDPTAEPTLSAAYEATMKDVDCE